MRERERFFASAALVWAYGGHQVDGMALYLRGSYLISRLAGLSICCTFYITTACQPYSLSDEIRNGCSQRSPEENKKGKKKARRQESKLVGLSELIKIPSFCVLYVSPSASCCRCRSRKYLHSFSCAYYFGWF